MRQGEQGRRAPATWPQAQDGAQPFFARWLYDSLHDDADIEPFGIRNGQLSPTQGDRPAKTTGWLPSRTSGASHIGEIADILPGISRRCFADARRSSADRPASSGGPSRPAVHRTSASARAAGQPATTGQGGECDRGHRLEHRRRRTVRGWTQLKVVLSPTAMITARSRDCYPSDGPRVGLRLASTSTLRRLQGGMNRGPYLHCSDNCPLDPNQRASFIPAASDLGEKTPRRGACGCEREGYVRSEQEWCEAMLR